MIFPNPHRISGTSAWHDCKWCRGIGYAGGLRLSPEEFKKDCAKVNLEFILPSPPL